MPNNKERKRYTFELDEQFKTDLKHYSPEEDRVCNYDSDTRVCKIQKCKQTSKNKAIKVKKRAKIDVFGKDFAKRPSTVAGWDRGFTKYSPSKQIQISPITASEANLTIVISKLKDIHVDMVTWVVNMSEQFFYDNAFVLLSHSKQDPQKMLSMLHRSFVGVDMAFFNNLENVTLLGAGTFGSVYSCRDPKTKVKFAIKHLKADFKKFTDHAKNLLDYMDERNAVIRSMDSPLVVKFYYSLQIKIDGALFLFFEFCIGDLVDFIDGISLDNQKEISEMLFNNSLEIIQKLYKNKQDLLEVCLVYIFEMFSALDFLVKCNIIHQDIKPDNIMISDNLHLKLGDFGLTYKTRMIHRETNTILVDANEIDMSESTNYEVTIPGTREYRDFELHLMMLEDESIFLKTEVFTNILKNKKKFDSPMFEYTDDVLEPSFLIDTWAVGITSVMLLFRGFEIFNPKLADKLILKDVPRRNRSLYLVHLIGRKKIYDNYIKNSFNLAGGKRYKDLMNFLATIFRPRLARCEFYTKEKDVYHFKEIVSMTYLDMDKVEKISTFSERYFNRSNIHLREIPKSVRTMFRKKKKPQYKKFKDFLNLLRRQRLDMKVLSTALHFDPGVNINFFS